MDELLEKLLLSLNCCIINPIAASYKDKTTIGWYCKSTSLLRKSEHLKQIQQHINQKKLPYYISDSEHSIDFFIYINPKDAKH